MTRWTASSQLHVCTMQLSVSTSNSSKRKSRLSKISWIQLRSMCHSTYTHTHTLTHILIKEPKLTVKCIIIQRFSTFYVFSLVLYAIIRQSQTVSSSGETCATSLTDTTSKKTGKKTTNRVRKREKESEREKRKKNQ